METIGTVTPPHPQPPSLDSPQEGFDAESIRLRFWIEGSKLKFKFFFFCRSFSQAWSLGLSYRGLNN